MTLHIREDDLAGPEIAALLREHLEHMREITPPGSVHALEGVAHVCLQNGSAVSSGEALSIEGADQVLVLVDLRLLYDPDRSQVDDMRQRLAGLPASYDVLLKRHAARHGLHARRRGPGDPTRHHARCPV